MKDGQYYQISGWMGKRLGLRGNDLICFAIIYGFSMDGESQFKGNLTYLAECMFATQPTALMCLKKLLGCNLILKQEELVYGKKRCYYATNIIYNEGTFDVIDTTKEPLVMTTKESLVVTTKEPLVHYNIDKYNINNNINKRLSNDNQKEGYSEDFISFWQLYHNGSKQQAYKEWIKLKLKEKQDAIDFVNDYLMFCKWSGRKIKDTSSYLHQKGFNEGWLATPDCYEVKEGDFERLAKFKRYMVEKHKELIYHRNPLTFQQIHDCFEKYTLSQTEWALNKLKERDIHQYFSIEKGIEAVISDNTDFEDLED